MVPGSRDILFAGSLTTDGKPETKAVHVYETEHLTCFIGGMVGMAAKIFDIKGDLDIAKRLTDGCVWAYSSMPAEVMAESAVVMPCESMESCTWNETAYYYYLDPAGDDRDRQVEEYVAKKAAQEAEKDKEEKEKENVPTVAAAEDVTEAAEAKAKDDAADASQGGSGKTRDISNTTTTASAVQKRTPPPRAAGNDPQKPLSHKEYVEGKIRNSDLPSGYVSINRKNYILR